MGYFVSDSIIKDAETSVELLGVDQLKDNYAVIRYKGQMYKVYIDNNTTKQMEVYMGQEIGEVYLISQNSALVIYKTHKVLEIIVWKDNGDQISYGLFSYEINGNKIILEDGRELTISNNGIISGETTLPKTNGFLVIYCDHTYVIDEKNSYDGTHVCSKCGRYEFHTNFDNLSSWYSSWICDVCGYRTNVIGSHPEHSPMNCSDDGMCQCEYCTETYYDQNYDVKTNCDHYDFSCDDYGQCRCNLCGTEFYDEEYDTATE